MNWVLIPICNARFGLKSSLEILMRQEKLKPHGLDEIIKLSAAASYQVRTPTKIDRNPACGVLALRSELQTKKNYQGINARKNKIIQRTVSKEKTALKILMTEYK